MRHPFHSDVLFKTTLLVLFPKFKEDTESGVFRIWSVKIMVI